MSQAFPTPFAHQGNLFVRGVRDYAERMLTHQQNAKELQRQHTTLVPDIDGHLTQWESPQALRTFAHELELADECMQAMGLCTGVVNKSRLREYQHSCYCKVRKQNTPEKLFFVSLSLREVSNTYAIDKRSKHAPPGALITAPVLATCHASNAPGLSPVVRNHWQVNPKE